MIGHESDEGMPLHVLYDFEYPARDDARVIKRHPLGGAAYGQFDTFREMIAWGKTNAWGVKAHPQRCVGMFKDTGGNVCSHLDPVMESLGFEMPVATGPRCAIYLRADAAMITSASVDNEPKRHFFRLGGTGQGPLRRILGEIVTTTSLELEIDEWDPPL
ncbi:hypothetical protein [Paraliomyxa miuraensis]|uniref:hypothetical protein n=1 Tax=Paraliomyxa miuraensis TaxID=376150 RepID=UPI00224F397F|nr:hypothetical protein [Paraliomyxa miuraensis]MCX4242316.1 hypothetical protein [Paraliomyxa miuraensis]